ncbi:double homeobox protein A-like [Mastomys coucha]|uniref:double homeobox protein A-like n=1 Tax=Mastomys coucha TaxID=35658 RepID=UPI0012625388|nr:double homeobox protein A-like [Mastomys coucha]
MEADSLVGAGGSGVAQESQRRKMVLQAWQKKALLSPFTKSSYLSFKDRQDLARETGLQESRICVWFQNRRTRTGDVGHAPKRSSRGSSHLASPHLQEEHVSSAQGRGSPSDRIRPRTRLTLLQLEILGQAFERNSLPGFATREELSQRTGLPEDTIHIWFQNRRARHPSRGRSTAQDQDLQTSHGSDGVPGGAREHDDAQDILLPVSAAGNVGMDTWSPGNLPTFCREFQPSQVSQPSGAGQA